MIYWDGETQVNRIYAAGMWNFGYYISSNGGQSFSPHNDGVFMQGGRTHLAIPNPTSNKIYAVSAYGNYFGLRGVIGFVSTNGGYNFTATPILTGSNVDLSAATSFMFVEASPNNPQTAIVGFGTYTQGGGLYRTTNGGATYPSLDPPWADQNDLAFNPYPGYENEIILGDDQGLFKSTNLGSSWTYLNNTLTLTECYRIAASPDDNNLFIAVTDAGFFKKLSGTTWVETHGCCDGTQVVASKFNAQVFLGSKGCLCNYPNMNFTTNGGTYWENRAISWGLWDGDQDWIAAITQRPPDVNNPSTTTFYHPRRNLTTPNVGPKYIDINVTTDNGNLWSRNLNGTLNSIFTNDDYASPQTLTFVQSNPQIIYVSVKSVNYYYPGTYASDLYKSVNGGQSWITLPIHPYVPNRVITSVATDPQPGFENVVYITFSGFAANTPNNIGHVFQSNDGGNTWMDISSWPMAPYSMPDLPVNQMVVRRISATRKQLIISTDAGVYTIVEGGSPIYLRWQTLATGLPNAVAMGMHYNEATLKLRVATFGRGVYEVNLQGPVYVSNDLILVSNENGVDVGDDIVVGPGATLKVPGSATIKMPPGKKIIVQSGGQIDVPSGQAVTFTSQSGSWGGIEFQGTGYGTLSNCTFTNTTTPITIASTGDGTYQDINITGCTFTNCGPVQIDSRPKVNVQYCTWNYTSASTSPVIGVFAVNSNETNISFNNISYMAGASFTSGIWVTYGEDLVLHKNTITNSSNGIYVGNSSPFVSENTITNSSFDYAMVGMSIVNCYSPTVKYNMVTNYQFGLWLENSSPIMFSNVIVSENTVGAANTNSAMWAEWNSNAILSPSGLGGGPALEEAGNNKLRSNQLGEGIHVNYSLPVLDYGSNTIYGLNYYIEGTTGSSGYWYARCNNWVDNPVDPNKFVTDVQVVYDCPGGGGAENDEEPIPPPEPYIINYGHGVYDTIRFINRNMNLTQDKILFSEGSKLIYDGSYTQAISKFQQVIQNYQDSSASINAMKKIIFCYDKMNADTSQYNGLRNYYLALAQNNPTDSAFVKVATELAAKCMVRNNIFYPSITEYENIITNSSDSLQILNSELNIIQLYMIASQQGNGLFVAKYESLRPGSKMDGVRMIGSKIFPKINNLVTHTIPKEFKLYQNYPNPFNPLTKIKFELPNDVNVTIKIYDLLGREVTSIVRNEFRKAGSYEIQWNASNFASGVYFYRIEAGDFVDAKKMVLVK